MRAGEKVKEGNTPLLLLLLLPPWNSLGFRDKAARTCARILFDYEV